MHESRWDARVRAGGRAAIVGVGFGSTHKERRLCCSRARTMLGSGLWIMKTSTFLMLKSLRYRSIDSSIHSVRRDAGEGGGGVELGVDRCPYALFIRIPYTRACVKK